jgi:SAM-dependent methyltransferase
MDKESIERAIRHCYSTWGGRYYDDYYRSDAAYPPVHTALVRELLQRRGARTVLDAGCGPASMLRDLQLPGLDRYGFDLTPEMVVEARRVLAEQGVAPGQVWQGSVLDPGAYAPPGAADRTHFDAALCFGVLPHVPPEADSVVLANLAAAVGSGAVVACEARNMLFALFTLNRYSRELFGRELIREGELAQSAEPAERAALEAALRQLDGQFRMDLPPVRKGYEGEPGYDEVLSRTHNPFILREQAVAAGLQDVTLLFYHYHRLPPMLDGLVPGLQRRESVAMEDPLDWRGYFMASAFIVVGTKP